MLQVIFYVKGINKGYEGYEVEDVTKKEAQSVYSAKNKIITKKTDDPVVPYRDTDKFMKLITGKRSRYILFTFPLKKGTSSAPMIKISPGGIGSIIVILSPFH